MDPFSLHTSIDVLQQSEHGVGGIKMADQMTRLFAIAMLR
jgi:hypothetical protein